MIFGCRVLQEKCPEDLKSVFLELFQARRTKPKSKISRHTKQFFFQENFWQFEKGNFESFKWKILTVWKGKFWQFGKQIFDSLKIKMLTVWKGKFWQIGKEILTVWKENFDSLKSKILTVWKGNFDSLKREIFDSLKRKILTVWKGKFWQFGKGKLTHSLKTTEFK